MDKENQPPHPKKPKLSLSLKKNRFKKASRSELQQNTDINTRWAMKNFTDWLSDYNLRNPESVCPEEVILPSCPAETLNKWFQPPNKVLHNITTVQLTCILCLQTCHLWFLLIIMYILLICQTIQVNNVMKITMIVNSLL